MKAFLPLSFTSEAKDAFVSSMPWAWANRPRAATNTAAERCMFLEKKLTV